MESNENMPCVCSYSSTGFDTELQNQSVNVHWVQPFSLKLKL